MEPIAETVFSSLSTLSNYFYFAYAVEPVFHSLILSLLSVRSYERSSEKCDSKFHYGTIMDMESFLPN